MTPPDEPPGPGGRDRGDPGGSGRERPAAPHGAAQDDGMAEDAGISAIGGSGDGAFDDLFGRGWERGAAVGGWLRQYRRRLLVAGGGALAAVAAVMVVAVLADDPASTTAPGPAAAADVGGVTPEALPIAVLGGFDGAAAVDLERFVGEPLIVNFWATWCAPCVAEMPDFQRLHESVGDRVTILGVDTRDSPVNAAAFVQELGITYPLAVDADNAYFDAVGGFGMPTTLFVDRDGRIAWRHTGALELGQMGALVSEHLGVDVPGDL